MTENWNGLQHNDKNFARGFFMYLFSFFHDVLCYYYTEKPCWIYEQYALLTFLTIILRKVELFYFSYWDVLLQRNNLERPWMLLFISKRNTSIYKSLLTSLILINFQHSEKSQVFSFCYCFYVLSVIFRNFKCSVPKSQHCVKKSLFLLFAAEGINLAQSKKSCEEL